MALVDGRSLTHGNVMILYHKRKIEQKFFIFILLMTIFKENINNLWISVSRTTIFLYFFEEKEGSLFQK